MKKIITLAIALLTVAGAARAQSYDGRGWKTDVIDGCYIYTFSPRYDQDSDILIKLFESRVFVYSEGLTLFSFIIDCAGEKRPQYFFRDNNKYVWVTVEYYYRGNIRFRDKTLCLCASDSEDSSYEWSEVLEGDNSFLISWLENSGDIYLSVPLADGSESTLYVRKRNMEE